MIKLKSIIKENSEESVVNIDKSTDSLTGPTVSPEQKMMRIPQQNWNEFLLSIKNKIIKNQNIPEDKAWKLTYGIFGGHRTLTPKMFDVINNMTPLRNFARKPQSL